jgi:hypothetical protein
MTMVTYVSLTGDFDNLFSNDDGHRFLVLQGRRDELYGLWGPGHFARTTARPPRQQSDYIGLFRDGTRDHYAALACERAEGLDGHVRKCGRAPRQALAALQR